MVAKLHPEVPFEWQDVTTRGFAMWVTSVVDTEAISELLLRENSITFLVHHACEDQLLRQSGQSMWLVKTHHDDTPDPNQLLWLAEDKTWQQASETALQDTDALGLAVKKTSTQVRHALRYRTTEKYEAAARKHGLEEQISQARFKVSGIDARMGLAGIYKVLEECAGYKLDEVIYHAGNSAV
eukprot:6293104-Amphidinium_carterae.1